MEISTIMLLTSSAAMLILLGIIAYKISSYKSFDDEDRSKLSNLDEDFFTLRTNFNKMKVKIANTAGSVSRIERQQIIFFNQHKPLNTKAEKPIQEAKHGCHK